MAHISISNHFKRIWFSGVTHSLLQTKKKQARNVVLLEKSMQFCSKRGLASQHPFSPQHSFSPALQSRWCDMLSKHNKCHDKYRHFHLHSYSAHIQLIKQYCCCHIKYHIKAKTGTARVERPRLVLMSIELTSSDTLN